MSIYTIGILGKASRPIVTTLSSTIEEAVSRFGMKVGQDVVVQEGAAFRPDPRHAAAAVYLGGDASDTYDFGPLIVAGVPVLPVVQSLTTFSAEVPASIRHLNGLAISDDDKKLTRVAASLLECVGLLPRQRRVFLSYRRSESRVAALQLFEAFAARHFDVFLDTHGVPPAEDFQAVLWHRLCDSDVLVMLDTSSYFASRWTAAELGRALVKHITVLRVGWPGVNASPAVSLPVSIDLQPLDFEPDGRFRSQVVESICHALEDVRSKSVAIRHSHMNGVVRAAMTTLGGAVEGFGPMRAIHLRLAGGRRIVVYPAVGVPTSEHLFDAAMRKHTDSVAVMYDSVGLHRRWEEHLGWLSQQIGTVRHIKAHEAGWKFADWL
jgi:hypothetical protein